MREESCDNKRNKLEERPCPRAWDETELHVIRKSREVRASQTRGTARRIWDWNLGEGQEW